MNNKVDETQKLNIEFVFVVFSGEKVKVKKSCRTQVVNDWLKKSTEKVMSKILIVKTLSLSKLFIRLGIQNRLITELICAQISTFLST